MLILGEQQLRVLLPQALIEYVRQIESEKEVAFKHNVESLREMTREALVILALEVQAEVARQRALANEGKVT